MNIPLAFRALALLAFVAASTAVIVGTPHTHHAVVALAHG